MTRYEAINLLDNLLGMVEDNHGSDYDKAIHMAIEALEQPERKKGKWIEITDHEIPIVCKCTECGWLTKHYDSFTYCPNCGAKMMPELTIPEEIINSVLGDDD